MNIIKLHNTELLEAETQFYKKILLEAQTQESIASFTDASPAGGVPFVFFNPSLNQAALTASQLIGPTGVFINKTRPEANSYKWVWGDSTTSTDAGNPVSHTYSNTGSYLVSLQVTNSFLQQTSSATLAVTLSAPTIAASFIMASSSVSASSTLTFTNQSSYNGQGTLAYTWSFGTGSLTSSLSAPTPVLYNNSGAYTASLAITESSYNRTSLVTASFRLA
jgi:PKD repeat protein